MEHHSNIASLVRRGTRKRFEATILDTTVLEAIHTLYDNEVAEIPTDKGYWSLREQRGLLIPYLDERMQEPKEGFCAIYSREEVPKTVVRGNLVDDDVIYQTLGTLTDKVLEPGFFSLPHRLNADEGQNYLSETLMLTLLGGIVGCAGMEVYNVTQGASFINGLSNEAVIGTGGVVTGGLIGTRFSNGIGRWADRKRLTGLPPEASGFEYGFIAEEGILEEYETLLEEIDKQELRRYAGERGYELSGVEVEVVYDILSRLSQDSGDIESAREHLRTPFPLEVAASYMMEHSPLPSALLPSMDHDPGLRRG